jgi:hypothetical protein
VEADDMSAEHEAIDRLGRRALASQPAFTLGLHLVVPTVHEEEGLRYFFFSDEGNEPPHVHVERDDVMAKFWLNPVGLVRNDGLKPRDIKRATRLITERQREFLEKWHAHHNG